MVFRLTWIASTALLGLVILRLSRVFLPTDGGLPWQLVALAAAGLGAVITWVALKARLGAVTLLVAHVLLFGLFAFLYVGGDIAGSAPPPLGVTGDIVSEVSEALTTFRYDSPPVHPLAGIVALAAMMLWALSAVAMWGLLNNAPYLSIIPPVVFYLQLAVIDRQTTGMLWTTVLLLLVGGGLAAIASDQRSGGGHAGHGRQAARIQALAVPVIAVVAVTAVSIVATRQAVNAETVPSTGFVDWTSRSSGIGGGFGGVSYNPFIDVKRSLVRNSDTPVFQATITGDIAPNEVYFRLWTMDTYDATRSSWYASGGELEDLDGTNWEDDRYEFRGRTIPVTQTIRIDRLQSEVLPAAYSPIDVFSEERKIAKTTRVYPADGTLHVDGVTGRGMIYQIQSLIPDVDAAVLAADSSGTGLSPLFKAAARDGNFQPAPTPVVPADSPRGLDRYRDLPNNLEGAAQLRQLAENITFGLDTDYERALALEHYFRTPGISGGTARTDGFEYSINIAPNEGDSDLATWLLDDTSPGYHTGYCEQFSASMGVLARLLDIPTRTVLGFTPGDVQADGTIVVRDRNAHAWVEVWLPAQGWVRFDPTPRGDGVNPTTFEQTGLSAFDLDRYFTQIEEAARAAAQDPDGANPFPNRDLPEGFGAFPGDPGAGSTNDGGFTLPRWLRTTAIWAVVGTLLLGTVPAIKRRRRKHRLRRLEEGDISAAWAVIVDRLIDSGVGLNGADTPIEVASATEPALHPLATVYSESVYGPDGDLGPTSRETASSSLTATERNLRSRESRWQRLRRTYRVRSLLPDWIKRTKR